MIFTYFVFSRLQNGYFLLISHSEESCIFEDSLKKITKSDLKPASLYDILLLLDECDPATNKYLRVCACAFASILVGSRAYLHSRSFHS